MKIFTPLIGVAISKSSLRTRRFSVFDCPSEKCWKYNEEKNSCELKFEGSIQRNNH